MAKANPNLSHPRLFGTTGRWGCLQIVVAGSSNAIVVDLQTHSRDTHGHSHFDHATAALPLADARLLRDELSAALDAAVPELVPAPDWQTGLTAPETARWGLRPRRAVAS